MSCDEHGTECQYACGYYAAGKDLAEHERHEHANCPRCGAKAPLVDEDGLAYSVTHRSDCPRLVPGHRYEDEDDEAERADVLRMRREMAREAGDDSPGADLDDGYPDSERDADALAYQRNGDDERDDQ